MDGSVSDAPPSMAGARLTWFSVLSKLFVAGAALASVGAVSLHLSGYVAQRSFLSAFNVDPDGFPRTADWMLVNGYYSVIDSGVLLFKSLISWPSLIVFGYLLLFIVIYRWDLKTRDVPEWANRLRNSKAFQLWGLSFLYSGLSFAVVSLMLPVAMIIVLLPALAGETYGEKRARELMLEYREGCSAKNPCSEIWTDGGRVASGYVIATSGARLAFYDVEVKMVRLIEAKELELRSPLNPKLVGAQIEKPAQTR